MVALFQATLAPIVAPLVAEQAALRQVVERQAEQLVGKEQEIGAIREERGRLAAELEAEQAARQQLLTERDAAELSRRRDRRRLAIGSAVFAALTIAALLVPAWVQ